MDQRFTLRPMDRRRFRSVGGALARAAQASGRRCRQHGERTVIERCQIARYNCGSAEQAIDCVLAYYRATDEQVMVAFGPAATTP